MEIIKEQILRVKCPSSQKKVQDFMNCLEKDLGNEAQSQKWDMGNCKSIRRIKGKNTDKGRTMDKIFILSAVKPTSLFG